MVTFPHQCQCVPPCGSILEGINDRLFGKYFTKCVTKYVHIFGNTYLTYLVIQTAYLVTFIFGKYITKWFTKFGAYLVKNLTYGQICRLFGKNITKYAHAVLDHVKHIW